MKRRRTWKAKVRSKPVSVPISQEPAIQSWQVVLAELKVGTASVGIRFNQEDTVQFFLMHKTPTEAARVVADIAKGTMTLKDIAGYDWQAVNMPHDYMENIDKKVQGEP